MQSLTGSPRWCLSRHGLDVKDGEITREKNSTRENLIGNDGFEISSQTFHCGRRHLKLSKPCPSILQCTLFHSQLKMGVVFTIMIQHPTSQPSPAAYSSGHGRSCGGVRRKDIIRPIKLNIGMYGLRWVKFVCLVS